MFSSQTQVALFENMPSEAGAPWPVTLSAEVYRELVVAARQWAAFTAGPVSRGATVAVVRFEPPAADTLKG